VYVSSRPRHLASDSNALTVGSQLDFSEFAVRESGLPPLNPVALGLNFYQAIVPDPLDTATVYLATYDNGLLVYSGR
jgi:hypothetical protein